MAKTSASSGLSKMLGREKIAEFISILEKGGVTVEHIRRFLEDRAYAAEVARAFPKWAITMSVTFARAKDIMGNKLLGAEEAKKYLGIEIKKVPTIPYSEEMLREYTSYCLVLVPEISILELLKNEKVQKLLYRGQDWIKKEHFAEERGELRWRLIPTDSSFEAGKKQLAPNPILTREVFYMTVFYFLANRGRPFGDNTALYCDDRTASGRRVGIGGLDPDRNKINYHFGQRKYGLIGIITD